MKKIILLLILASAGAVAQLGLQSPGFVSLLSSKTASAGCDTLKDSNTDTTGHIALPLANAAGNTYRATKFTAGSSYSICKLELLLGKLGGTGLPTGNVFAYVWSDSANPNTILATSDAVDATSLPTLGTSNYVAFTFPSAAALSSGSVYWIGISVTNININNYVGWWRPNPFVSGGVVISTNGTEWNVGASVRANYKTFAQ